MSSPIISLNRLSQRNARPCVPFCLKRIAYLPTINCCGYLARHSRSSASTLPVYTARDGSSHSKGHDSVRVTCTIRLRPWIMWNGLGIYIKCLYLDRHANSSTFPSKSSDKCEGDFTAMSVYDVGYELSARLWRATSNITLASAGGVSWWLREIFQSDAHTHAVCRRKLHNFPIIRPLTHCAQINCERGFNRFCKLNATTLNIKMRHFKGTPNADISIIPHARIMQFSGSIVRYTGCVLAAHRTWRCDLGLTTPLLSCGLESCHFTPRCFLWLRILIFNTCFNSDPPNCDTPQKSSPEPQDYLLESECLCVLDDVHYKYHVSQLTCKHAPVPPSGYNRAHCINMRPPPPTPI